MSRKVVVGVATCVGTPFLLVFEHSAAEYAILMHAHHALKFRGQPKEQLKHLVEA